MVIAIVATMVGCQKSLTRDYTKMAYAANVDPRCWDNVVLIRVPNVDTIQRRALSIFVKRDPNIMSCDSVNLEVRTITPDGVSHTDEVTMHFQQGGENRGSLFGRRSSVYTESIPYRDGVVWSQRGSYIVYIIPKSAPVVGIEAVGVELAEQKAPTMTLDMMRKQIREKERRKE
ncbi:MAG: hypothetical protein SNI72_05250 [Rikenellaceae bacterium]